uniref:Uncharacterized protein n=1 Tax=Photinus pyralis TaxID=7054 RepID=A0A1Y1NFS7_PHOPY
MIAYANGSRWRCRGTRRGGGINRTLHIFGLGSTPDEIRELLFGQVVLLKQKVEPVRFVLNQLALADLAPLLVQSETVLAHLPAGGHRRALGLAGQYVAHVRYALWLAVNARAVGAAVHDPGLVVVVDLVFDQARPRHLAGGYGRADGDAILAVALGVAQRPAVTVRVQGAVNRARVLTEVQVTAHSRHVPGVPQNVHLSSVTLVGRARVAHAHVVQRGVVVRRGVAVRGTLDTLHFFAAILAFDNRDRPFVAQIGQLALVHVALARTVRKRVVLLRALALATRSENRARQTRTHTFDLVLFDAALARVRRAARAGHVGQVRDLDESRLARRLVAQGVVALADVLNFDAVRRTCLLEVFVILCISVANQGTEHR